jgi:hypothetical protein
MDRHPKQNQAFAVAAPDDSTLPPASPNEDGGCPCQNRPFRWRPASGISEPQTPLAVVNSAGSPCPRSYGNGGEVWHCRVMRGDEGVPWPR